MIKDKVAHTRYIVVNLEDGKKKGFAYKNMAFTYATTLNRAQFLVHNPNTGDNKELFRTENKRFVSGGYPFGR